MQVFITLCGLGQQQVQCKCKCLNSNGPHSVGRNFLFRVSFWVRFKLIALGFRVVGYAYS